MDRARPSLTGEQEVDPTICLPHSTLELNGFVMGTLVAARVGCLSQSPR